MCTLTVIPRDAGYLLGMNRDERIARDSGLPPEVREVAATKAIYPSDSEGGTWIAANEYGIALALLNWNNVTSRAICAKKSRSRGLLIPALVGCSSLIVLHGALVNLNVEGMRPFRLVGVVPSERKIGEWRWDSIQMRFLLRGWEARHWFSSSLSDDQAESLRGAACRDAWNQPNAGSAPWLRRLHASHNAAAGPFSLCVHRPEVRTLSYSEIECTCAAVRMKHSVGSPCATPAQSGVEIEFYRNIGTWFAPAI